MLKYNPDSIDCTNHTFFRLSSKQREIFTCEYIKEIILQKQLYKVGIQNNGAYALFYPFRERYLRVIIELTPKDINVITFYIIGKTQIPK